MYRLIGTTTDNEKIEIAEFQDYKKINTYWSIVENDKRYIEAMIIRELADNNPVAIRYHEFDERKPKALRRSK